jgi:hypothetical protein
MFESLIAQQRFQLPHFIQLINVQLINIQLINSISRLTQSVIQLSRQG